MGRMMLSAVERAGLSDVAERALSGDGVSAADLERLRKTDVLVLAGLADAVREKHRGDDVRVLTPDVAGRASDLKLLELDANRGDGPTGQELLVQIALARLTTPRSVSIGVSFEQVGLELAQTALVFGADALVGDLGSKRTLPLLDGPSARRAELSGLIERTGRTARFQSEGELGRMQSADEVGRTSEDEPALHAEQRS